MSSGDYLLVCRRQRTCREGTRLYFSPDGLCWENWPPSSCRWAGKQLVASAVRRSQVSQASLVTFLSLPHQLLPSFGYPSNENQKNYIDFMLSPLPLFCCTRLGVGFFWVLIPLSAIEATPVSLMTHFWIRSP